MKTVTFSQLDRSDEKRVEQIAAVAALPQEFHERLVQLIVALEEADTTEETFRAIADFAQDTDRDISEVLPLVRGARWFTGAFLQRVTASDTPADMADDAVSAGIASEEERENLEQFLQVLRAGFEDRIRVEVKRSLAAVATLPQVKDWDFHVNFRPVFDEGFQSGDALGEYEPQCLGVVPVVTASVAFRGGAVSEVSFQMGRDEVRRVRDILDSLEKDFTAAERFLGLGERRDE